MVAQAIGRRGLSGQWLLTRFEWKGRTKLQATVRDITERRLLEEERLRNLSLQQMMSTASPMGYLVVDNRNDEILFFNKRFCEIWGIEHLAERMERGELKNADIIPDCLPVLVDVPAFAASCEPLQSENNPVVIDDEIPFTRGRTIRRYSTHLRGADDRYYGRFYLFEDVTLRKQAELREATRSRTMTALASGAPLADVLTTLVRGVEAECSGTLGSVLLLDAAGTHLLTGAAPSLPEFYNEAIHGTAIGPAVGSCGTTAFTGERVVVSDIATNPRWTDHKALAAQAGLSACWSEPIRGTGGRVLGTFAFYYAQPRVPSEAEFSIVVATAQLAAVAIERKQAEAEKGKLQEQLVHSHKMKAVGTLAGGIAHDFNNILMGLLGGLSLLEVEPSELAPYNDPAERQSDIQDMKGLVERGAQLTSQLLGFARLGKYDVKPLDLGDIVAKTSAMFGSTRRDIIVHLEVEPALSPVLMDHSQMEQVLLNLFINASQAMEGGGQLRVRLEEVLLGPKDTEAHEATPGQFVKIVVTDTGTGMDAATQARIFEPFFTTKEPGKGTGLGLASVYGILKNYSGFIEVESEQGKGTTFTLFLPASAEPVASAKDPVVTVQRGKGTILVVDDEAMVLKVCARILGSLGYEVLSAEGGKEAVELLRQHGARVSLVILDLTMPEMSGAETYRALRDVLPGVKVLLSSGYSSDGQVQELLAEGCSGFMQKPFDASTLSVKVSEFF